MNGKTVVMDGWHITVSAPTSLTPTEYRSIRRPLHRPGFRTALNRAVRELVRRYPSLAKVRIVISR